MQQEEGGVLRAELTPGLWSVGTAARFGYVTIIIIFVCADTALKPHLRLRALARAQHGRDKIIMKDTDCRGICQWVWHPRGFEWRRWTVKNWILKLVVVRILFPIPHMLLLSFIININYPVGEERVNIHLQTSGLKTTLQIKATWGSGSGQPLFSRVLGSLASRERSPFVLHSMVLFAVLHKTFWLHNFLDFCLLNAMIPLTSKMYLKLAKECFIPPLRFLLGLEK